MCLPTHIFYPFYKIKGPNFSPSFFWNQYGTLSTSKSESSQFLVTTGQSPHQNFLHLTLDHWAIPTQALDSGNNEGRLIPASRHRPYCLMFDDHFLCSTGNRSWIPRRPPSSVHIHRSMANQSVQFLVSKSFVPFHEQADVVINYMIWALMSR